MKRFDRTPPTVVTGRDLIALHLRELSPAREQTVRRALELDPALRAESDAVAATLAAVKDFPMTLSPDLLNRQWQALRPSLLVYPAPAPSLPGWRFPMLAAVALAGVCGVWWLTGSRPAPSPPVYLHVVPGPDNGSSVLPPPAGHSAGEHETPHGSQRPEQKRRPLTETVSVAAQEPAVAGSRPPVPFLSPADSKPNVMMAVPNPSEADRVFPVPDLTRATLPTIGVSRGGTRKVAPVRAKASSSHPFDLTLALGASVTGSRHLSIAGGNGIETFTASTSPVVSVALHQQFHPYVGYRATLSYTRPDYTYVYKDTLSPYTSSGAVHNGILEFATTYVFQGPHKKRVHTAADVGAGLMTFIPLSKNSSSSSFRYAPAGVLGASADYALSSKWRVRLSYRAQVFRTQQFEYTGDNTPVTKDLVVSHEPSVGISYRFGKQTAP